MPKINGSTVRQLLIPLPSPDQLDACLEHLELALARIDRLTTEIDRAAGLLERIEEAILAKAFRGELVAGDAGDDAVATSSSTNVTSRVA